MSTPTTHLGLSINDDLEICVNEWETGGLDKLRQEYAVTIVKAKEQMVRDALIFLGWTPPEKEKTVEELKEWRAKYESRS